MTCCKHRDDRCKVKVRYDLNAYPLLKGTAGSVGFDLRVKDAARIDWRKPYTMLATGVSIELPDGYEAQVRPRSSLCKRGLFLSNSPGTIDFDYRGQVCILVTAMPPPLIKRLLMLIIGESLYRRFIDEHLEMPLVYSGDALAQLVVKPCPEVVLHEVSELSQTQRGTGGFGSTGR